MNTTWFSPIIYLCAITNLTIILCDIGVKQQHTLVLFKQVNIVVVFGFTFKPRVQNTEELPNPSIYFITCDKIILEGCLNRIKGEMQISDIPNGSIFIQVFLVPAISLQFLLPQLNKQDYKIIDEFLIYVNVQSVRIYTPVESDILVFSEMNIDIQNEIFETHSSIIYRENKVIISFVVRPKQSFPELTTYGIRYRDKQYTVVTNTFGCVTPLQVSHIIYWELIQGSKSVDQIRHPCMPRNTYFVLNPNNIDKFCVVEYEIDAQVTFIGDFNFEECQNYIKEAITQKIVRPNFYKPNNFVGMRLPFFIDNRVDLKVYTTLLEYFDVEYPNRKTLKETQQHFCNIPNASVLGEGSHIKCLESILLEYLIYEILGYREEYFSSDSINFPENSAQIVIFVDPRIGPLVEIINIPQKSVTSTIIESQTDISTIETSTIIESQTDISTIETSTIIESQTDISTIETSTIIESQTDISTIETSTSETLPISSPLGGTTLESGVSSTVKITTIAVSIVIYVVAMVVVVILVCHKFVKSSENDI